MHWPGRWRQRCARLVALILFGFIFTLIYPAPVVFAAHRNSFSQARIFVIIVIVILAILMGLLLYNLSRRSSDMDVQRERASVPAGSGSQDIDPAIYGEVSRLTRSAEQRQVAAKQLSDLLNQRVEAQVTNVRQELTQKYEHVIQEKTKSEQVVRRRYRETLVEKKQTESVMRSIADGVVVVDNKGKVVFMNPAAEKLLAVEKEKKLGRGLTEDLRDEQLISLVKGDEGGDAERDVELNSKLEQTKRVLRASNAVIQDESGKTVGMVAVLSDVTKQRELDRMKSDFVSKVTHELRTPIVAIKHSLAVVQDGSARELSDPQKNFLSIAARNLERLSHLINDLLDLAKLEAKKMELHCSENAIGEVVSATCDTFQAWAASKSLTIQQSVQPSLPRFSFDSDRITQVLHNLVGNAMKFTSAGGSIILGVRLRADDQAIEVGVKDTGVGIAKEDLAKLFQKFQQVGQKNGSEISGTGLGLAISKEIVELHKGRIWVESEPGQGTTFLFTLPLSAATTSEGADGAGTRSGRG